MGADSTLVNAAYKLGQSNVPGDYSDIFNKQYEGLIASNKARYATIGNAFVSVGKAVEEVGSNIKERQEADMKADNLLFNNGYEETSTNVSNGKLKKAGKEAVGGYAKNPNLLAADQAKLEELKEGLEALANKSFLSKGDKKSQADLRRRGGEMKKNIIEVNSNMQTAAIAYSEDHINNDLSFKGSPDEQLLFAQVHSSDDNLEALGIVAFWDDDDELQYQYTPNRLQREYDENKRKELGLIYNPTPKGFSPGNTKTISAKKLTSMVQLKGVKANADANALITKAGSAASETIGKTKNLAHNNFDRVGASIYNDYNSLFLNGETNIQDLATREVLVGNTNRTYKKDIGRNGGIDEAVINQLGIGSDVFTAADLNGNGKLDASELEKHEGAKAEIIEKLTNPQTQSEREVAASELARYWTSHAKSEFDYIKGQTSGSGGGGGRSDIVEVNIKNLQNSVSSGDRIYSGTGAYYEYDKDSKGFLFYGVDNDDDFTGPHSWENIKSALGKHMTKTELSNLDSSFAKNYGGDTSSQGGYTQPDLNFTGTNKKSR